MMVQLWGCMIHFFIPNQKLKMQCNFIMNRSIASGPHTTPKIVRTRLTKNQKVLYICMYVCIYKYTHTKIYMCMYISLSPSLSFHLWISFFLLLPFFLSLCLYYSVLFLYLCLLLHVSLCLCLQPIHSLTLLLSLSMYASVSLSFFIPACLVFLAKYLSLFYYVNLALFP